MFHSIQSLLSKQVNAIANHMKYIILLAISPFYKINKTSPISFYLCHFKILLLFIGSFANATCMKCKHKVTCEDIKDEIFNQVSKDSLCI